MRVWILGLTLGLFLTGCVVDDAMEIPAAPTAIEEPCNRACIAELVTQIVADAMAGREVAAPPESMREDVCAAIYNYLFVERGPSLHKNTDVNRLWYDLRGILRC